MSDFLRSFVFARSGLIYCIGTQRNIRVHFAITFLVLLFAVGISVDLTKVALLVLCCAAVISAEVLNTSIESVVDLCTNEQKALAKIAKDTAAAAVMILAAASSVIGLLVLVPQLYDLIKLEEGNEVEGTVIFICALVFCISLSILALIIRKKNSGFKPADEHGFVGFFGGAVMFLSISAGAHFLIPVLQGLIPVAGLLKARKKWSNSVVGATFGAAFAWLMYTIVRFS